MANLAIEPAFITHFMGKIHVATQQEKSMLDGLVRTMKFVGEDLAYDGLEGVEAQEVFGSTQPVIFSDIESTRRKLSRRRFHISLPIDEMDTEAILMNPNEQYSPQIVRAFNRMKDRVLVEAMFADVSTGKNFGTTVTYAADGGNTVDATAGLTYAKLLEIKEQFMNSDVGTNNAEDIIIGLSGKDHTALMNETNLISGDFSNKFVVDQGMITRALGMRVVYFAANAKKPILPVVATTQDGFAMSTRAMVLGVQGDIKVSIKPRNDLIDVTQVQATAIIGAVRTEGKLIQKLQTTV